MAAAQGIDTGGRFGLQARRGALDGAGQRDVILGELGLFAGQRRGLAHVAGAQIGGFAVHDLDQGAERGFGAGAEGFSIQGFKRYEAFCGGHYL